MKCTCGKPSQRVVEYDDDTVELMCEACYQRLLEKINNMTFDRIMDGMVERQTLIDIFHWDCPFCGQINDYEDIKCAECGKTDIRFLGAGR